MESIIAKNIKFFLDEKNQTVKTLSDMSKLDYGFAKAVNICLLSRRLLR